MGMMRHRAYRTRDTGTGYRDLQTTGLKAVVVPEIAAIGSKYLITLEAIDARSQKFIALKQEEADSKDKVIAALGRATSGLPGTSIGRKSALCKSSTLLILRPPGSSRRCRPTERANYSFVLERP